MKKTYYSRILLMYSSVLFFLLVVFIGIFIYQKNIASQEKIETQDRVLFNEYIQQEEAALETLVTQAHNIQNMNSLAAYAFSSKDNYYSTMTQLHNDFSKSPWSGNPTYMIHKLNDTLALTTLYSAPIASQLKIYGIEEDTYQEVLRSLGKSDRDNGRYLFSDIGILYLTTKTFVNNRVVISVFYSFEPDSLIHDDKISFGFFVENEQSIDLREEQAPELAELFHSEASKLEDSADETLSFYIDNSFLVFHRSRYAGRTYYFRRNDVSLNLLKDALQLIPILLLVFMLSFLLIRHLSKLLYAPIDHLVDLFLEMDPDMGGNPERRSSKSSSEIDYLASQVSKVRSENRALTEHISEMQAYSRNKFLAALINGTYNEDSLEEDLTRYHLEWLDKVNYIVCCALQDVDDPDLTGKVLSIAQKKIEEEFQLLSLPDHEQRGYFILHTEDKEKLKDSLSGIVTLIDTAFDINVVFFIAKKSQSAINLQYSFMTIEKIETNRQQLATSSIYDFSEIRNTPSQGTVYPVGTEAKLLSSMQKGTSGEMKKTLTYIFQEYLEREFDHPQQKEYLAYAFVNTVNRAFLQAGIESDSVSPGSRALFDEMMHCDSVERFEKKLLSVFEKIYQLSDQKEESQINDLKMQIEEYITENLSEDISLITISNHFHLTPNYMSSIFKDVMKENFKDYLSRCRFNRIVSYLSENPSVSVREAGELVGIHSPTTLTRLFKKFADCSPGQYVEKQRQQ